MKQNGKKVIVRLCTALLCVVMFSLSVSASELMDYREEKDYNMEANTEAGAVIAANQIQKVYELLNSPLGKPYRNDGYFDGSEIQIYEKEKYYLIGLQGKNGYSYLFFDKEKKTLADLGIQNEIIRWYKNYNISLYDDGIVFYCTGKKREDTAPIDFPYTLFYDIEENIVSKKYDSLMPDKPSNDQCYKSYMIGSERSNSIWEIEKLEVESEGLSIHFNRLKENPIAKYDYPQMKMETEENGKVMLWIENCTIKPEQAKGIEVQGMRKLQAEMYHKGKEYGSLITFEVKPDYILYGKIGEIGYPNPMNFSFKKSYQFRDQEYRLDMNKSAKIKRKEWKAGEDKLGDLQTVGELLMRNKNLVDSIYDGYKAKTFILNQPSYYLIGLDGYLFTTDYYLYDKNTDELIYLLVPACDWGGVSAATMETGKNKIIFPVTGYGALNAGSIPYTLTYDINTKNYTKNFQILSGDNKFHYWDNNFKYAESIWEIDKIEQKEEKLSFYFELIEEINDIDLYFPEVHFESDEKNRVTIWIKNCEIKQEQISQLKIEGVSNIRVKQEERGDKKGTSISFILLPGYYLFGENNARFTPGGRTDYLTFYVHQTCKLKRPYYYKLDF